MMMMMMMMIPATMNVAVYSEMEITARLLDGYNRLEPPLRGTFLITRRLSNFLALANFSQKTHHHTLTRYLTIRASPFLQQFGE